MKCLSVFRFFATASALVAVANANADSSGKWQNSQEVYNKVCAYCHEANVGPVITASGGSIRLTMCAGARA